MTRGGLSFEKTARKRAAESFSRAEQPQQREGRYRIAEISDAVGLLPVLADAIGVSVTVVKQRRLVVLRNAA